ncbi:unnamed protein product [Acanthosepion pharaonis]|uniref:Uncharacterized protein n=1 Tax=Acanthosepion pharaonis TaxID=158019 RepID=A0A812ERT3_ACAPH|nr:unnamed protein product [Sepia pharaonis]
MTPSLSPSFLSLHKYKHLLTSKLNLLFLFLYDCLSILIDILFLTYSLSLSPQFLITTSSFKPFHLLFKLFAFLPLSYECPTSLIVTTHISSTLCHSFTPSRFILSPSFLFLTLISPHSLYIQFLPHTVDTSFYTSLLSCLYSSYIPLFLFILFSVIFIHSIFCHLHDISVYLKMFFHLLLDYFPFFSFLFSFFLIHF